jgi:hypothetical protein
VFASITIDAGDSSERLCNGHAELCDRPYDDGTYAGSHNAMASADRQYISAMHDLTMGNQLDQGVRTLLTDAHYWERPETTQAFLDSAPPVTAEAKRPLLSGANPQRPGAWWCHVLCRLGAQELTKGFAEIERFVARHPDAVVTIIIEDYVSRADIDRSVRDSGFAEHVFHVNHWITRATGSREDAGIVNDEKFILERARRCERKRGHRVNIVAVDFTTIGGLFEAVDVLNGVERG